MEIGRLRALGKAAVPVAAALGLAGLLLGVEPPQETARPLRPATVTPLDAGAATRAQPLAATVVGRVAPLAPAGRDDAAPDRAGAGFRHQWPAVYAAARFEGDALIVAFDDAFNRYRIVVEERAPHVVDRPGRQAFRLDGLGPGTHEARIDKISESADTGAFLGFFVPRGSVALAPPAPRARQIEFIGDSDTVGYGNAARIRDCEAARVFLLTDTQLAFGPKVAARFEADYQVNAASGIGMVRNYAGAGPEIDMGRLYPRVLRGLPRRYDFDGWSPQIIVIALGTNDFKPPVEPGERWVDQAALRADFEAAYQRFLAALRHRNPEAFLLVAAFAGQGADYGEATRAAAAAFAATDRRIDVIDLPRLDLRGCGWHPSREDHERVAATIAGYIERRPELWLGR